MEFDFDDHRSNAFGACAIAFSRAGYDRRIWNVVPFGDTGGAGRAGIYPCVECVMDDFGDLVPTRLLSRAY